MLISYGLLTFCFRQETVCAAGYDPGHHLQDCWMCLTCTSVSVIRGRSVCDRDDELHLLRLVAYRSGTGVFGAIELG